MPDVFLSYNREDQTIARRFAEALIASDIEVWWDTALKTGDTYDDVTEKALRGAKAVVVMWSTRSVASRWVRAEATLANRLGTLVPVMIEACERPILFELIQTTDLIAWNGAQQDGNWLSFLTDLREKIARATTHEGLQAPVSTTQMRASHFGPFSLLPDRRVLLKQGKPVEISTGALDLLRLLIRERAGPKPLLEFSANLPSADPDPAEMSGHINALRKILGPNVIRTIPGRGYQFVADLLEQGKTSGQPAGDKPEVRTHLTNLPDTLPRLYGREHELAELGGLISKEKLITICGAGGMGKSSIARAVAFDTINAFEDGVWWIELASLSQDSTIVSTIARTLDVALSSPDDVGELALHLNDRRLLLVLDNCEHLIDSVATVVSGLLEAAPNLHLLATSQEILRLPREYVCRLEPLSVPDARPSEDHEQYGAMALFEARASAAAPEFALNEENWPLVADICSRLDGLPLAIELAAARLALLGLEGLHQRLNDRFRLLASKSRAAPSRQRTLRAALEWSYGLLSEPEKCVFSRLGVFVGYFDLASAEQICADENLQTWDVVDHIEALVDKSLLSADTRFPPRYRLLDTPRTFALEQLDSSAEAQSVRRRHAECMLSALRSAEASEWGASDTPTHTALIVDIPNIRAALDWASSADGDANLFIELAGSGSVVWRSAKIEREGLAWAEKALRAVTEATPPAAEAELLVSYAIMSHQKNADREIESLNRAARLFSDIGDTQKCYFALGTLAKKYVWQRNTDAAEKAIAKAQKLFDPFWPPAIREPILQAQTYLLEIVGRPEEGESLMLELLDIMRALDDPARIDTALLELAESYVVQGKYEDAASVHLEVIDRTRNRGEPYIPSNLGNLTGVLTRLNRIDEAVEMGRLAIPLLQRQRRIAVFLDHYALLACRRGKLEAAARICGRADIEVTKSGFEREVSEATARETTQEELEAGLDPSAFELNYERGKSMTNMEAIELAVA